MNEIKLPCKMEPWDGRVVDANDMYVDIDEVLRRVNNYDRLREALREVTATLAWVAHGECRAIQDDPIMPSAQAQEVARALLTELDNLEPKP